MVIVVCTGGEEPPHSLCLSWLDSCQKVIAADGGLGLLRHLGHKADLWIGDGDSLGPLEPWLEWFEESRILEREKDDTDTEAAVKAALEMGADEIWLVGGSGRRMDHWWANLRLAAIHPQLTRWLTRHEHTRNLSPGDSLALDPGTVSIFPLGSGPWVIQSSGLRWPLDGLNFDQWHSLSNVAFDGAQLNVVSGRFVVLSPFEESPRGPLV